MSNHDVGCIRGGDEKITFSLNEPGVYYPVDSIEKHIERSQGEGEKTMPHGPSFNIDCWRSKIYNVKALG